MKLVFQERLQFVLRTQGGTHGFGLLEAEAALLDSGIPVELHCMAGIGIHDCCYAALGLTGCCQARGQIESMNRFWRRIQKEVRHVHCSLLVFECGGLAGEGEFPNPASLSDGILSLVRD